MLEGSSLKFCCSSGKQCEVKSPQWETNGKKSDSGPNLSLSEIKKVLAIVPLIMFNFLALFVKIFSVALRGKNGKLKKAFISFIDNIYNLLHFLHTSYFLYNFTQNNYKIKSILLIYVTIVFLTNINKSRLFSL